MSDEPVYEGRLCTVKKLGPLAHKLTLEEAEYLRKSDTRKGYVLLHKDHADVVGPDKVKGTILTLTKKPEEAKPNA